MDGIINHHKLQMKGKLSVNWIESPVSDGCMMVVHEFLESSSIMLMLMINYLAYSCIQDV